MDTASVAQPRGGLDGRVHLSLKQPIGTNRVVRGSFQQWLRAQCPLHVCSPTTKLRDTSIDGTREHPVVYLQMPNMA